MRTTLTTFAVAAALVTAGAGCKKSAEDTPTVAQKPVEQADQAAENLREAEVPSLEQAKEEMAEANREIGEERVDVREERGDVREERADVAAERREAGEELRSAFIEVRDDLVGLSKDAADFVQARDRVAADVRSSLDMIDQRIAKLQARAGTLTGNARAEIDADISELKALAAEARSEAQALSAASAETWENARDQSLDSLQRLFDRTAEAAAEIMVQ